MIGHTSTPNSFLSQHQPSPIITNKYNPLWAYKAQVTSVLMNRIMTWSCSLEPMIVLTTITTSRSHESERPQRTSFSSHEPALPCRCPPEWPLVSLVGCGRVGRWVLLVDTKYELEMARQAWSMGRHPAGWRQACNLKTWLGWIGDLKQPEKWMITREINTCQCKGDSWSQLGQVQSN